LNNCSKIGKKNLLKTRLRSFSKSYSCAKIHTSQMAEHHFFVRIESFAKRINCVFSEDG